MRLNTKDTVDMQDEKYIPENLELWSTPSNWFGTPWDGYYVFLGQHRDSDCLTRSNFQCALKALEKLSESETVQVVCENHWAVGWVEWIAIHETDEEALRIADEIMGALSDYPILDESHYSEMEMEEANQVWESCYDEKERIEYIRKNRSQFEFRDFADMMSCIRGKYFAGYASELLY